MKETNRVSPLLLERYHLGEVSAEERELVEAALSADKKISLRNEILKESDNAPDRLYPIESLPALSGLKDAIVPVPNTPPRRFFQNRKKLLWGIGAAAVLLCILFPLFYFGVMVDGTTRRVGIFIGSNDGWGKTSLQYAGDDALMMSKTFGSLGGIAGEDNILLMNNPTVQDINDTLNTFRDMAFGREKSQKMELVFYYSGHSDEDALLLKEGPYDKKELMVRINNINVDMRLVILDTCFSGTITQKGEDIAPAISDSDNLAKGTVLFTSSSGNQASYESDRLKGSYFTLSLAAGLRGAAAEKRNSIVTMAELVVFVRNEIRERAFLSFSQLPDSKGHRQFNKVALADINKVSAKLSIDGDLSGELNIWGSSNSLIIAVANKNKFMEFGLEPGHYRITISKEGEIYQTEVFLEENSITRLTKNDFSLFIPPKVYVLGSSDTACYWVDGEIVPFPFQDEVPFVINAIAVADGRIYVAGQYGDGSAVRACYWVDGEKIDLPSETRSTASVITIADGRVYVAGQYHDGNIYKACYWADGEKIDLPGGIGSDASAITAADGRAYVAGHYYEDDHINKACYWADGEKIDLPGGIGSAASAIAVADGKSYVAGQYYDGFISKACYWLDGEKINMEDIPGGINSYTYAIAVEDNKIYVAGSYSENRKTNYCYWVNGIKTNVTGSNQDQTIDAGKGMAVAGGNVYISGRYISQGNSIACYWLNGIKIDLPSESRRVAVFGIALE